jgi:uncharacterized protein YdaU (DUF1376 family)
VSAFDWHARYHQAALDGMLMLTLEERGAYNTCLDLIYSRRAPIPDDDRWLSGWMGCSLRKWASLRATLIVKGKLAAVDHAGVASLTNGRAAFELETQAKLSRNRAETGAKGGRKRAENAVDNNKNKDLPQANVKLTGARTETEQDITERTPVTPNGVTRPKIAKARSRRVPGEWMARPSELSLADAEGFTPGEIEREIAKFRDHEFRDPKTDWDAAFRRWIRTAAERRPSHERPNQPSAKFLARQANLERAFARSEDVADRRDLQRARG